MRVERLCFEYLFVIILLISVNCEYLNPFNESICEGLDRCTLVSNFIWNLHTELIRLGRRVWFWYPNSSYDFRNTTAFLVVWNRICGVRSVGMNSHSARLVVSPRTGHGGYVYFFWMLSHISGCENSELLFRPSFRLSSLFIFID